MGLVPVGQAGCGAPGPGLGRGGGASARRAGRSAGARSLQARGEQEWPRVCEDSYVFPPVRASTTPRHATPW